VNLTFAMEMSARLRR